VLLPDAPPLRGGSWVSDFDFHSSKEHSTMNSLIAQIRHMYAWAVRAASTLQSPFLLFVRLYWGWQLSTNGWAKLHNLSRVTDYFTSLGVPAPGPTAGFIATVELLSGILLVFGLFSRFVGLVLTIDMTMAYIIGDREALFSIFSDPDKFTAAAPYTTLFAALLILIFGPGKLALDTCLLRRFPFPTSNPT
jgi:putative oxidoreductase